MKKILLINDSDTYIWCLQKYLQRRGYPVETASTLKETRTAIQEEMPLIICCDLDLPDGSGMDFLDEVRAADKELPFILASCHDKSLAGREEVSLSPRTIIAPGTPSPGLRLDVDRSDCLSVITSCKQPSWRRAFSASIRVMYLLCRIFSCQAAMRGKRTCPFNV